MRLLIAGDTHEDIRHCEMLIKKACSNGVTKIIQVGDFGLWDHYESGVRFLDTLNHLLRDAGATWIWLDGNHENHDRLDWYVKNNPKNKNGHVFIRSHILYSPRGHKWQWEGKWYMTVGGAYSIDKSNREIGRSWWPGETLTEAQTKHIEATGGKVDFLFTHDCPTNVPMEMKQDVQSHINRQLINRVAKATRPRLWFHGHMHNKMLYDFLHQGGYAAVVGLDCNGQMGSWGILDTDAESFHWDTGTRAF